MATKLHGRAEIATITRAGEGVGRAARVRNEMVYLLNGGLPVGSRCLVRIALKYRKSKLPPAYFLTTQLPEDPDFQGLAPKEYICIGLWNEEMRRHSYYPRFGKRFAELEGVYSIGKIPLFCFLETGSSRRMGRFSIDRNNKRRGTKRSIHQTIKQVLPDPLEWGRLILGADEAEVQKAVQAAKHLNITPILLEPRVPE